MARERWRRFWRRPGPLNLLQSFSVARRMNAPFDPEAPDETPITRVVSTILQQAIRERASQLTIDLCDPSEIHVKAGALPQRVEQPRAEPISADIVRQMREEIAKYGSAHEAGRPEQALRIRFFSKGAWRDVLSMPLYIESPIRARLKSMADLRVSREGILQQGRSRFDIKISTTARPYRPIHPT